VQSFYFDFAGIRQFATQKRVLKAMASEAPENGPSGGGSSSSSSPSKSRKSRKEKGSSSKMNNKSKDTSKKKMGQRSSDIYASALPLATKTKPETKEQLERWLLDTVRVVFVCGTNAHGLTSPPSPYP